jgi:hypothetical protein
MAERLIYKFSAHTVHHVDFFLNKIKKKHQINSSGSFKMRGLSVRPNVSGMLSMCAGYTLDMYLRGNGQIRSCFFRFCVRVNDWDLKTCDKMRERAHRADIVAFEEQSFRF